MPVVMTGIDAKHVLELAPAEDEQPVEALATDAATQRSACAFAFGACTGVRITAIPSLWKTWSKPPPNLESRSWISKRSGCCGSSIVISRLRACWAVQAPVGLGVQATNSIRRRSSERKKST